MKISLGNKKDIEDCLRIASENKAYFNDDAVKLMKKDFGVHSTYVCKINDLVVGFASINKKDNQLVEISWMAVDVDHQGNGIGKSILQHLFVGLKKRWCKNHRG